MSNFEIIELFLITYLCIIDSVGLYVTIWPRKRRYTRKQPVIRIVRGRKVNDEE